MDFVDWRKGVAKPEETTEAIADTAPGLRGKRPTHYVEEMIREAQARGDFDNLEGMGKPLKLREKSNAGDNSLAYDLLKSNGYAPPEIELTRQIDIDYKRAEAKIARMIHLSKALRTRRMSPFEREKRAFNASVEKTAKEYEQALRRINSSILTLNITVPAAMHRPLFDVDALVKQFRAACPLFNL